MGLIRKLILCVCFFAVAINSNATYFGGTVHVKFTTDIKDKFGDNRIIYYTVKHNFYVDYREMGKEGNYFCLGTHNSTQQGYDDALEEQALLVDFLKSNFYDVDINAYHHDYEKKKYGCEPGLTTTYFSSRHILAVKTE